MNFKLVIMIATKDNKVKLYDLKTKTERGSANIIHSFNSPTIFNEEEKVLAVRRDNNFIYIRYTDPVFQDADLNSKK